MNPSALFLSSFSLRVFSASRSRQPYIFLQIHKLGAARRFDAFLCAVLGVLTVVTRHCVFRLNCCFFRPHARNSRPRRPWIQLRQFQLLPDRSRPFHVGTLRQRHRGKLRLQSRVHQKRRIGDVVMFAIGEYLIGFQGSGRLGTMRNRDAAGSGSPSPRAATERRADRCLHRRRR